jgi:hypothetical protein
MIGSFNWILGEAEKEYGITFTNDMTPRARLMHDTLFECERAANVGGAAAAAGDAAAAARRCAYSLSLSL